MILSEDNETESLAKAYISYCDTPLDLDYARSSVTINGKTVNYKYGDFSGEVVEGKENDDMAFARFAFSLLLYLFPETELTVETSPPEISAFRMWYSLNTHDILVITDLYGNDVRVVLKNGERIVFSLSETNDASND